MKGGRGWREQFEMAGLGVIGDTPEMYIGDIVRVAVMAGGTIWYDFGTVRGVTVSEAGMSKKGDRLALTVEGVQFSRNPFALSGSRQMHETLVFDCESRRWECPNSETEIQSVVICKNVPR